MILALDVGNSNIVIGCLDDKNIYFEGRLSTDRDKTEMEYAVMFKNILDIYNMDISLIEGSVISSVVPPLNGVLGRAVSAVTGFDPVMADVRSKTSLKIEVDNPDELGSDLLVAAAAAVREFKPPLIIIDMGTATTFSVINNRGALIGGAIMPGVRISQEALSGRTSQLPSINLSKANLVIGRNTIDCMKSGILHGTAAMTDGMIERIEEELGEKTTVVATGGLAANIISLCRHEIILRDDLLLRGLWLIYKQNA